jgi:hypothetical protein
LAGAEGEFTRQQQQLAEWLVAWLTVPAVRSVMRKIDKKKLIFRRAGLHTQIQTNTFRVSNHRTTKPNLAKKAPASKVQKPSKQQAITITHTHDTPTYQQQALVVD